MSVVKIFIVTGCRGCQQTLAFADWLRQEAPRLVVEVIDLALDPDASSGKVFAVPTYVYDNRQIFIGNPSKEELSNWVVKLGLEV
ncbi:MAG: thioredoxin family protein [SAR202 cluster bacterium]|nr:thioredoxin family protein [SAR202 cluster bacterium]